MDSEVQIAELRQKAESGDAGSQYRIGLAYLNGNGVPKDDREAAKWVRAAADQGLSGAQFYMGWLFEHGRGVGADAAEAVRWYQAAAKQGEKYSQYYLGRMYARGSGVAKDDTQAAQWFQRAADAGVKAAQRDLGNAYYRGNGVPQSDAQALIWFRKAAEQGDAAAQNNLGRMLYVGRGTAQDYPNAALWFRKAADQRHAAAQNFLGLMYEYGRGVERDAEEAAKWYRLAADQGYAAGQHNLATMYGAGLGVEEDAEEAVKWYRLAADQGHAHAQNALGVAYENGNGVEQDAEEAVSWYRRAAEQGNAAGQYNLGTMFDAGSGVEEDAEEAATWYEAAADQGHAAAQNALGVMYETGRGVDEDAETAVKWYRLAADQGNAEAQYNLGTMYENGLGVEEDVGEALDWYSLAADQGHEAAQEALERLEQPAESREEESGDAGLPLFERVPDQAVGRPAEQEPAPKEPQECRALLEVCTPHVYRRNAFRISGLLVDSSARDIKRRLDELRHAEEFGDASDEHQHAFALVPPPDLERIREAAQALQDPERRLVDEFFWFWPADWGAGRSDPALTALASGDKDTAFALWSEALKANDGRETLVAKHNMAVLYHMVALDSEHVAMTSDLATEQHSTIAEYWRTSFQWWEELTDDESFWSMVTERIRVLGDARLTTGFARRMRASFPEAMDKINALLAISFIENGKHELAENHVRYMVETHAGQDNVPKTMSLVTKPLFGRIRSVLGQTEKTAQTESAKADAAALNLLAIAVPTLGTLGRFLPKDHAELADVREAVFDTSLRCVHAYLNGAKDAPGKWDSALDVLGKVKPLAVSEQARNAIAELEEGVQRGRHLSHPKIGHIESLLARTVSEDLGVKLKTLGGEVAKALHEVEQELGAQSKPVELTFDLVAGAMRGMSVDVINRGQELVGKFLEFLGNESNRLQHQLALQRGIAQAVELERKKWDAVVEMSVGIDLYDKGRELARSSEMKERFASDAEAVSGVRQFCSQITELAAKKREKGLVLSWWIPRTPTSARPPPIPQTASKPSSSGCFVATAVYGSYDHPCVLVLRVYRDQHLARNAWGRGIIRGYYIVGPHLSRVVDSAAWLRRPCKWLLDRAVRQIENSMTAGQLRG